jgi:osmotically-inducible protein OsmY
MDAAVIAATSNELTTDVLVSERVLDALRHSSYPDLRRLRCACHHGIVQLDGAVGSYFLKQMAQATAARVEGIKQIDNRLRVEASTLVMA